jgi:AcrR family transcriptional regulator
MKSSTRKEPARKRGPKSNQGEAREEILAAARREFGGHGFERATLRTIAEAAGVDVALVSYYFGSKDQLFIAALDLPVNPADALEGVLEEGLDGAGERVLTLLLKVWDDPATGAPLAALFRSLGTRSKVLSAMVESQMVKVVSAAIPGPDADLRATAFVAQVLGLVLGRYILKVEPMASAGHGEIIELVAPTLQRYLTG